MAMAHVTLVFLAGLFVAEAGRTSELSSVRKHEQTELSEEAHFATYNADVAQFRSDADQGTLQKMSETEATSTKGNELCCMCSKFKDFRMVAFSAEDYDLDFDGRMECARECFGKCSKKSGTYMGCFDENTMVKMQRSWAMTGMLKVKEDDGPGDIC
eukprot:TRINITY_DN2905_c0_g1_i2.p1 TRINITY_DN2905_c0_g1~~TRINITY_DN2905_c0_g1_i2.p1  ORF type:complete len:157 (-),score=39.31 TRINITY_DN2905_c0_g1_i2:99-569(-)